MGYIRWGRGQNPNGLIFGKFSRKGSIIHSRPAWGVYPALCGLYERLRAYRQKRLSEPSGRTPQFLTKPATVNREIACLKTIFNKAVTNDKAERNPVMGVKLLKENNERDRILSPEEYARFLAHCPAHLKPIFKLAYYTGMRQGEILNLVWDRVDLSKAHEGRAFIKLKPEDTKTKEGRLVPLNQEMIEMFQAMPRGFPTVKVFTYLGKSVEAVRRSFGTACMKAGIEDFTFHDLRHTFINNRRVEGHDYFHIMANGGDRP